MPCSKCQHVLIYYKNNLECPKCSNYNVLDSLTASIISCMRVRTFRNLWKEKLIKIDRSSLLLHITTHRETIARKFFQEFTPIELDQYFADTLFLKRVLQYGNPNGQYVIDDTQKSEPIISLFRELSKVETDDDLINSGYAVMLYDSEFVLSHSLSSDFILKNFTVSQTEEYLKLSKSYENYGLYARETAEQKFNENKPELQKLLEVKGTPYSMTSNEFIKRNYETICSLYIGLIRNEIYSEVFDLRKLGEIITEPSQLMELMKTFRFHPNAMTRSNNTAEFLLDCRNFFKTEQIIKLKKILLFDDENPNVFPLFVRIKNKDHDFVIISHTFTAFMYILLHAIITKKYFDAEADRRGYEFEKQVRKKFEDLGFECKSNIIYKPSKKKQNLEMDVVAVKNGKCYVIECKHPRLPPLVESSEARKNMAMDLRGIVDGFKRTTENGIRITKTIPSLLEKINYVKDNFSSLGFSQKITDTIYGIIVTVDYPVIENYKGIDIFYFGDISPDKINL